jgi:hypothetical protein
MLRLSDDTIRNLHNLGVTYQDANVRKLGSHYEAARFLHAHGIPVANKTIMHYLQVPGLGRRVFSVSFLMADVTGEPMEVQIPGATVKGYTEVAVYIGDVDTLCLQYYEARPGMLGRYFGLRVKGDLQWEYVIIHKKPIDG